MKIKELQKTVNIAWSPVQQNPIYLAAGTSAQQLDASFSTNASLEVYSLNLAESDYEMELCGSVPSAHRFNKVVWSSYGFGGAHPNGLIVGACENGFVQLYSASKIIAREDSALLGQQSKHNGSVLAVDFNPFQANLIATGAADSEIFIWDLNNIANPMTPGTKVTPNEDVLNVHWNKQVQHILASVFASKCVIWDLRKNEPIIKLHDTQSRVRWRSAQWNPEVATQIWIASEEDAAPAVQLWDLRYATAPTKSFQIHQRGVLGLSWCTRDTDLMISCGKDSKILCWNPNTNVPEGEILSEIASTNQWCFDVSWCPRNPALVAGCSFDGTVSIYSLFGGSVVQAQTTSKIADSFPGMDNIQAPLVPQTIQPVVSNDLKKPPKWLRRPAGATFAFGGKLISFNNKDNAKQITVSQVVTDMELVERSTQLEEAIAQGNFIEYCKQKADQSQDQHTRYLWYFIKANFEANPRAEMLNLLGYQVDETAEKFKQFIKKDDAMENLSKQIENTSLQGDGAAVFDQIHQNGLKKDTQFHLRTGPDAEGLICEALLTGNIEAAVDLCMDAGRSTDAIILAMTGGSELLARTQYRYLRDNDSYISNVISALVTRDWTEVVNRCSIETWKEALVAILTHSEELSDSCQKLGEKLCAESHGDPATIKNAILCAICSGNMEALVDAWQKIQSESSPKKTPKNIQELVEIIMIMQKASEIRGKSVEATGKVAEILSNYATLLATQGSLASALTYLGPSLDPDLVALKDRLYFALGHKQAQKRVSAPVINRFTRNSFSHGHPPQVPTPTFFQPQQAQQSQPQWGSPVLASTPSLFTPAAPTQPALFTPSMPPVAAPPTDPRPPSVNSGALGGGGPLSRKYVLDPSVRSNAYGQTATNTTSMYGGNDSNSYAPSPFAGPIPPVQQFNQFNTQPFGNMPTATAATEIGQPAMLSPPQKNPTPPPGWNDPPPARHKPKPVQYNASMSAVHAGTKKWGKIIQGHQVQGHESLEQPKVESVAPITHPLFGGDVMSQPGLSQPPTMMNPMQPTNGFHDQNVGYGQGNVIGGGQQIPQTYQPFVPQPTQAMPAAAPIPAAAVNQQPFMHNAFQPQPVATQNQPTISRTPEPPKQKAPLPEEFIYLQTVLEELRTQCISAANNPQTKRKLDDVAKRLEQLYDLLRENRLSQNTLASLNQLVQLIQIGDYANGLGLHTQMASGPDFSQIACFMPGVKILLQCAMQLQVYLR